MRACLNPQHNPNSPLLTPNRGFKIAGYDEKWGYRHNFVMLALPRPDPAEDSAVWWEGAGTVSGFPNIVD